MCLLHQIESIISMFINPQVVDNRYLKKKTDFSDLNITFVSGCLKLCYIAKQQMKYVKA